MGIELNEGDVFYVYLRVDQQKLIPQKIEHMDKNEKMFAFYECNPEGNICPMSVKGPRSLQTNEESTHNIGLLHDQSTEVETDNNINPDTLVSNSPINDTNDVGTLGSQQEPKKTQNEENQNEPHSENQNQEHYFKSALDDNNIDQMNQEQTNEQIITQNEENQNEPHSEKRGQQDYRSSLDQVVETSLRNEHFNKQKQNLRQFVNPRTINMLRRTKPMGGNKKALTRKNKRKQVKVIHKRYFS